MSTEPVNDQPTGPQEVTTKMSLALEKQDRTSQRLQHPFRLDTTELNNDARTSGFMATLEAKDQLSRLGELENLLEKHTNTLGLKRDPYLAQYAFIEGISFRDIINRSKTQEIRHAITRRLGKERSVRGTRNTSDYDKGFAYLAYRNEEGRSQFKDPENKEEFTTRILITMLSGEMAGMNLAKSGIERLAITNEQEPVEIAQKYTDLFRDFIDMNLSDQEAGRYGINIKTTFKEYGIEL